MAGAQNSPRDTPYRERPAPERIDGFWDGIAKWWMENGLAISVSWGLVVVSCAISLAAVKCHGVDRATLIEEKKLDLAKAKLPAPKTQDGKCRDVLIGLDERRCPHPDQALRIESSWSSLAICSCKR